MSFTCAVYLTNAEGDTESATAHVSFMGEAAMAGDTVEACREHVLSILATINNGAKLPSSLTEAKKGCSTIDPGSKADDTSVVPVADSLKDAMPPKTMD